MKRPDRISVIFAFIGLAILILTFFSSEVSRALSLRAQAPHGTASEEVPRGAIDGINTTFTLNFQPAPWGSIHVYRNGLRQRRNLDYLLGGPNHTLIVFQPAPILPALPADAPSEVVRQWKGATVGAWGSGIPQPGDILLADYTY